jgi:hypothetical protein
MKMMKMFVLLVLVIGVLFSCASTGKYKTLESYENVETLGFVQTTFISRDEQSSKVINELAYIKLMEEASKTYSGSFDAVDITWAIGKRVDIMKRNHEYSANGRIKNPGASSWVCFTNKSQLHENNSN